MCHDTIGSILIEILVRCRLSMGSIPFPQVKKSTVVVSGRFSVKSESVSQVQPVRVEVPIPDRLRDLCQITGEVYIRRCMFPLCMKIETRRIVIFSAILCLQLKLL